MFQGFSQETIDFMWGIRFNNEKSWFEAHKKQYLDSFYHPLRALADEVFEAFRQKHPRMELTCRVTRIYRDMRRTHGLGPYKDHLWFCIERPVEDWTARAVYWFELGPEDWSYGLGYYAARPLTMAKFRARLDRDSAPFEKLARAFAQQDEFVLEGEDYKRPKGEVSPLLAPWYNKKNFSLSARRPNEGVLFTPELSQVLFSGYERLLPFYLYLDSLESDPDPRFEST